MKFTCEVEIELPVNRVIELFDNPQNMKRWQPGLLSFETISGTPGQPGAKSRLRYKVKNREMEMIETVTVRNLPDEFSGTYEIKGIFHQIQNNFISVSPDKTKWIASNDFQFQNWFMKIMGFLLPTVFKKESLKFMNQFKAFAESA